MSRMVLIGGFVSFSAISAPELRNVTLAWYPSDSPYVRGYVIHCGVESDNYPIFISTGLQTNVTVWGFVEGATYYFTVAAYNVFGLEGEMSNEISYTVPSEGVTNADSSPEFLLGAVSGKPPLKSVLKVGTSGLGTLSPNLNGKELVNGKAYTMTAVPAAGQLFVGWSEGVTSQAAKISFVMKPFLALKANFIANPFIPVAGTYTGLFYEEDGVRRDAAGLFTVSVTTRGTYSASFRPGKDRLSLSGKFDTQLRSAAAIKRKNNVPLGVEMRINGNEYPGTVSGHLADTNWTAQLLGDRASFNAKTNPSPFAGSYTLSLRGANDVSTIPAGDSIGSARVDGGGIVRFAGTLADGTKVSQSAPLSASGNWPLFVPLYSGKGLILSWVNFTEQEENDMEATVDWIKSTGVRGAFYPAGFTNEFPLIGSRYTFQSGFATEAFDLTNAIVTFSGGNLAAGFTNSIVIGANGRVTNLSSNRLTMNVSVSTGIFTGSATDPSNGKARSFSGAILQKQNIGAGFLLVTNQSSRVLITHQ